MYVFCIWKKRTLKAYFLQQQCKPFIYNPAFYFHFSSFSYFTFTHLSFFLFFSWTWLGTETANRFYKSTYLFTFAESFGGMGKLSLFLTNTQVVVLPLAAMCSGWTPAHPPCLTDAEGHLAHWVWQHCQNVLLLVVLILFWLQDTDMLDGRGPITASEKKENVFFPPCSLNVKRTHFEYLIFRMQREPLIIH